MVERDWVLELVAACAALESVGNFRVDKDLGPRPPLAQGPTHFGGEQ